MFGRSKKTQADTLREQLDSMQASLQDLKTRVAEMGEAGSGSAAEAGGSRLGRVGSQMLADTLADVLARMGESASSVSERASRLGERASGAAERVSDRAARLSDRAANMADRGSRTAAENVTGQSMGTDWSGILTGLAVAAAAAGVAMLIAGGPKQATSKLGGMWANYRVSSGGNGKTPSEFEIGAG